MFEGSADISNTSSLIAGRARQRRPILVSAQVRLGCTRTLDAAIILGLGLLIYGVRNDWRMFNDASLIAIFVGVLLGPQLLAAFGVYTDRWAGKPAVLIPRIVGAWAATIAGVLVVMFMLKSGHSISRLWIGSWAMFGALALVLTRIFLDAWLVRARSAGALCSNVVVVGGNRRLAERATTVMADDPALRIVGTSLFRPGKEGADLGALQSLLRNHVVDLVVLALNDDERLDVEALLQELKQFPCETCLMAPTLSDALPISGVRNLGRLPAVTLLETPIDGWHRVLKETEDRVMAALILALIAPLLAVLALAVKLTSDGPVLYRQTRLGFNLEPIEVLKFRTMYADSCDPSLSANVAHASRNDPRVTPLGRLMRRTSIDELPQLINVLKGEMSLVGPRPHAVTHDRHYSELINGYLGRHRVKPGITGWAQINGFRGEIRDVDAMRERIEHDLYYIDNWSIWFDLRILFGTMFVGFAHENAY
ncbi:MAG: undecaprenyl-phosphate glucose phosphotransferase [Pseudomonadota bacterium]